MRLIDSCVPNCLNIYEMTSVEANTLVNEIYNLQEVPENLMRFAKLLIKFKEYNGKTIIEYNQVREQFKF